MKLTDTQRERINRAIHEARGLCWHKKTHPSHAHQGITNTHMACDSCGKVGRISVSGRFIVWKPSLPDYACDLNVIVAAVVELVGEDRGWEYACIIWELMTGQPRDTWHNEFGHEVLSVSAQLRAVALCDILGIEWK